jgi:hypothetical protein
MLTEIPIFLIDFQMYPLGITSNHFFTSKNTPNDSRHFAFLMRNKFLAVCVQSILPRPRLNESIAAPRGHLFMQVVESVFQNC